MGIEVSEDSEFEDIEISCEKCTYFVGTNVYRLIEGDKARIGRCRRTPPDTKGDFSKTLSTHWCGEFYLRHTEPLKAETQQ